MYKLEKELLRLIEIDNNLLFVLGILLFKINWVLLRMRIVEMSIKLVINRVYYFMLFLVIKLMG